MIGTTRSIAPLLVAEHLPGHDVRVVLQSGDQDLVAGSDILAAVGLGDQVNAFGGAAHEDDLVRATPR